MILSVDFLVSRQLPEEDLKSLNHLKKQQQQQQRKKTKKKKENRGNKVLACPKGPGVFLRNSLGRQKLSVDLPMPLTWEDKVGRNGQRLR